MFSWLKTQFKWTDRVLNSRPWFRISYPTFSIEGIKRETGTLEVRIVFSGVVTTLLLDREVVQKLTDWLNRTYPMEKNNVIGIRPSKPLSIHSSKTNSEGSPTDPAG